MKNAEEIKVQHEFCSYEYPGKRPVSFPPSRDHSMVANAKCRLGIDPELLHLVVFMETCEAEFLVDLLSMVYIGDDHNSEIGVVCGKNTVLLRQVRQALDHLETFHFYEKDFDLSLLLDSADLLLSEPREIIASEAVKRRLPLAFFYDGNTDLPADRRILLDKGCAVFGKDEVELGELCIRLLDQEARRGRMSDAYQTI